MQCSSCNSAVTPGLEVRLHAHSSRSTHCPYCLSSLPEELTEDSTGSVLDNGTASERSARRQDLRHGFVRRLHDASPDGSLQCPVCTRQLNPNDEELWRDRDHFRCHRCGYDLAYLSYRQHVYDETRWQPLLSALADLQREERCQHCRYLGAVAKATEAALSLGVHTSTNRHHLLQSVLTRAAWEEPECDWEDDCKLVELYRSTAGEALRVL